MTSVGAAEDTLEEMNLALFPKIEVGRKEVGGERENRKRGEKKRGKKKKRKRRETKLSSLQHNNK
jgi:hypothetical protein